MPTDAVTQHKNLPKPHVDNDLDYDMARIALMVDMVDLLFNGIDSVLAGKAASAHDHEIGDVTGLQNALDTLTNSVTGLPDTLAALQDTDTTDVTQGMMLQYLTGKWTAIVAKAAFFGIDPISGLTANNVQEALSSLQATKANQADIQAALDDLVGSAPGTLDTLNELATALGNDPDFATTITGQIAGKLGVGDKAADSYLFDGLDSSQFLRSDEHSSATGQVTFTAGINTEGKDVTTNNGAFIANDSDGPFSDRSGTNIDHVWHDDSSNAWHFVSDGPYKSNGNSRLFSANFRVTGEALDLENQFIGKGQSWRSVSRSYNTSYRNTHNKSMMVCVTQNGSGSTAGNNRMRLQLSSNNSSWIDVGWSNDNNNWGGCISAIVPPGWYYRVPDNQIALWRELY